ncbi:hypothetical protein GCM10010954_17500 [Halobacillus andaensis]|uniref:Uncharacterized protein n=1 Tax=Halobacillus andaensis TaxID=1176239 RepID=A0A917B3H8_HALAA|nr:hypothetical protein [Halobacillus andaensis]MBP2004747.1 hypothetical protein [Halobacillus andaensis]GGF19254.1 hypothetical protein GCM10010954_17500 [Halobacillus andaensis]
MPLEATEKVFFNLNELLKFVVDFSQIAYRWMLAAGTASASSHGVPGTEIQTWDFALL